MRRAPAKPTPTRYAVKLHGLDGQGGRVTRITDDVDLSATLREMIAEGIRLTAAEFREYIPPRSIPTPSNLAARLLASASESFQ